jgi:hypothetical protein
MLDQDSQFAHLWHGWLIERHPRDVCTARVSVVNPEMPASKSVLRRHNHWLSVKDLNSQKRPRTSPGSQSELISAFT